MPKTLEYHGLTAGKKQPYWYQILSQIKERCNNLNHPKYKDYGGRGITHDPRYIDSPTAFFDDVGPRPSSKHTLDRIDNNKGYWPGNMRWATYKEQARNKRTNRLFKWQGKMRTVAEIAEMVKMRPNLLLARLDSGMTVKDASSLPVEAGIKFYTWKGETHKLATWAKKLQIPYQTLYSRLENSGWEIDRAFTTPSKKRPK